MSLKTILSILGLLSLHLSLRGQTTADDHAVMIRKIHEYSLKNGRCYDWLKVLCKNAGPRLAGHEVYNKAAEITGSQLATIPGVMVTTQQTMAKKWQRGEKEIAKYYATDGFVRRLSAFALGNSIGTGKEGIKAGVIEVQSLDEVQKLGAAVKGKIVFYNRPMDEGAIRTFSAYGGAVDQRVYGASKAAEHGAVAVLVRSMGMGIDSFPHTGTLVYKDGIGKIPALAISTADAEWLSQELKKNKGEVYIRNTSFMDGEAPCANVIGEIIGSISPDTILLVGGHLDSWDVGEGAHDDGSGCVQSMEVLNTLVGIGYKPRYTIRCVLFANEENGLAGGTAYAEKAKQEGRFHLAALESDAGGFSPRGFSFDADTSVLKKYYRVVSQKMLPLLESYGLQFETGGSGADIGPLKPLKGLMIGLRPDSQRYFDFHHTSRDVFENVHPRELRLGAAAMTSLIYLIDQYGLQP